MGRKRQAPQVDFSTQRCLVEVLAKARNLEAVLLEDDDDDDDDINVVIVDYVAARGQLQHSAPNDLAQGWLAKGQCVTFALQKTSLSTPSVRLRAKGARKRPLAHLDIILVLANIDADIFEVLAYKTRTKKKQKTLITIADKPALHSERSSSSQCNTERKRTTIPFNLPVLTRPADTCFSTGSFLPPRSVT
jgi:hypothetical protein